MGDMDEARIVTCVEREWMNIDVLEFFCIQIFIRV